MTSFDRWIESEIIKIIVVHNQPNTCFSLLADLSWLIWKSRNSFVFEQKPLDASSTIPNTASSSHEFILALEAKQRHAHLPHPLPGPPTHWSTPRPNFIKINSDAALNPHQSSASFGVLSMDAHGMVVGGYTLPYLVVLFL